MEQCRVRSSVCFSLKPHDVSLTKLEEILRIDATEEARLAHCDEEVEELSVDPVITHPQPFCFVDAPEHFRLHRQKAAARLLTCSHGRLALVSNRCCAENPGKLALSALHLGHKAPRFPVDERVGLRYPVLGSRESVGVIRAPTAPRLPDPLPPLNHRQTDLG